MERPWVGCWCFAGAGSRQPRLAQCLLERSRGLLERSRGFRSPRCLAPRPPSRQGHRRANGHSQPRRRTLPRLRLPSRLRSNRWLPRLRLPSRLRSNRWHGIAHHVALNSHQWGDFARHAEQLVLDGAASLVRSTSLLRWRFPGCNEAVSS